MNWTITNSGIIEGVGLSSSGITIHSDAPPVASPTSETTPTTEPTEPTDYDSLNKTELQVLCSQRGLSTSGTKAELIARLNESDNGDSDEGESEAEPSEEGEEDGGESESE